MELPHTKSWPDLRVLPASLIRTLTQLLPENSSGISEHESSMNIPETLDGIRNEDIPKLARYADKEANPLYPVPVLWGPSKTGTDVSSCTGGK